MKLYVITDLEGIAGVARWDQTGRDQPGYAQATRLMTEELRACVAGIQSVESNAEIWVWDAHGPGAIDVERFPRGALLINRGSIEPPYFLDPGFDAVFFLGQHARAGTLKGNLCHTYSSQTIDYYKINGIEVGEFGCRAALAGSFGIPTVFVSGDDTMAAEARALVTDIVVAQVKVGLGQQLALHLAPEDARDLIRDASSRATRQIGVIPPFVLEGPPFEQEIRVCGRVETGHLVRAGFRQLDATTFVKVAQRIQDLNV
ncbi:MAG: M55 family metallopeptidase [Anaerolineae bacterium]